MKHSPRSLPRPQIKNTVHGVAESLYILTQHSLGSVQDIMKRMPNFLLPFSGCRFFPWSFPFFVISDNNFVIFWPFSYHLNFRCRVFPWHNFPIFRAFFPMPLFHTLILCCPVFLPPHFSLPIFSLPNFPVAVSSFAVFFSCRFFRLPILPLSFSPFTTEPPALDGSICCNVAQLRYYRESSKLKKIGSLYSIRPTERRVPELIPVLGSQPAGDVSHKLGGRLPLVSARPAVTPTTLKRAATNFAAQRKIPLTHLHFERSRRPGV